MTEINWDLIRTLYEAGENPSAISRSMGGTPTKQAIYKRVKSGNWEGPKQREVVRESIPVPATAWEGLSDTQKLAIEAFANGARTIEEAAGRAGVAARTVRRWKEDEKFTQMCQAARFRARDELVTNIKTFGEREWRPNAWLLERLWKEEFGQQQMVVQGNTFNVLGQVNLGIDRSEQEEQRVIDVSPGEGQASET